MIDAIYNIIVTFCGCGEKSEFSLHTPATVCGFELIDICPVETERRKRRYSDACVWELPDYDDGIKV